MAHEKAEFSSWTIHLLAAFAAGFRRFTIQQTGKKILAREEWCIACMCQEIRKVRFEPGPLPLTGGREVFADAVGRTPR